MPYIAPGLRRSEGNFVGADEFPGNSGELNFAFSNLINEYVKFTGLNYQTINDVVGALEGAKLEFYRRIAVPYEDKKLAENGDVYDIPE